MIKSFKLAAIFCAVAMQSQAAEPFGIKKGTSLAELSVSEAGSKPLLKEVPKPHPLFKHYLVWAPEKTGVCMVVAVSKEFENDRYGSNIRNEFDKISAALAKQYGKPKRIDFKKSGNLWKDPDDWVMAIRQNERFFGDLFEKVSETENGHDLQGLEMQVTALRGDTAVIRLQYKFNNFDECLEAIDTEANESF